MIDVDPEKLKALELRWLEFERWWHESRSEPDVESKGFPGYEMISRHGHNAWSFYRGWLLLVFQELRGSGALYHDAVRLVNDARSRNGDEFAAFEAIHSKMPQDFHGPMSNLFYNLRWEGLSHDSVNVYVRKYEVEWPLVFWAQLTEISRRAV